jgi:hypothetical protein
VQDDDVEAALAVHVERFDRLGTVVRRIDEGQVEFTV